MSAKKFFIFFIFSTICLASLYLYLFYAQLGAPVKAEWWVKNVLYAKEFILKNTAKPRMIIISGSNSLFGIDSEVIEKKLGIPVVNFAIHANLDINFLKCQISNIVSKNDIVVMPLEFPTYIKKDQFNEWFMNNMLAWGKDYLLHLSIIDKLRFVWHTPIRRIINGLYAKYTRKEIRKEIKLSRKQIAESLIAKWNSQPSTLINNGYSYENLNRFGDIVVDAGPTEGLQEQIKNGYGYRINTKYKVSQYFLEQFREIQKIVEGRGGRLYLTWPVTMRHHKFDFKNNNTQNIIRRITEHLSLNGIDIYCNPAASHFSPAFFFNTFSHLNKKGVYLRTINLTECLSASEKNKFSSSDDIGTVVAKVKQQELEFLDDNIGTVVAKVKQQPFEFLEENFKKRISDLSHLKKALEAFWEKNGSYPISSGWDGLFTKYGESSHDWIKGLVPEFIPELPRDPRKNDDPNQQYLYRSNGHDYKLLAHEPEDCKAVKENRPGLVDPKRTCWAYGFWSEGAIEW